MRWRPPGAPFRWGVATSAYQIEGGRHEGGKGDSIWDRFSDEGRLGVGGDVACDHYHRMDEDLDLLQALGVHAYRFSISWSRVIPNGDGVSNGEGIAFYRRLVDGLRDRGIEPWVTLYHWDLPQALQDRGGWAERNTVDAFARFAAVVADALGDRVRHWITHNEPWVASYLGHLYGVHAPGLRDWRTALVAGHHMLVSHGRAVEVLRERSADAVVGIALDCRPAEPAGSSPDDAEATVHFDGFRNRWFFDPVFGRGYPDDILRAFIRRGRVDADLAFVHSGDMEQIAAPIDFLGLNYYTTTRVSAGSEEIDAPARPPGRNQESGFTEMGWTIDPDGLQHFLARIHAEYRPASIVITENGASYSDGPDERGVVDDRRRIEYLRLHIEAMATAIAEGVPVDGYFVWSLLDNLEWTLGFDQRFGLVWVDHKTQKRTPKASFEWYRESISADGWANRVVRESRSL